MSLRSTALLAFGLALACVNETGAKCNDDSNCPTGQICLAKACASGAPSDTGADAGTDAGVDAGPFVTAPHAPWPLLVYDGGPVLSDLQLVTIVTAGDPLAGPLLSFGNAFGTGQWIKEVGAEYGVGAIDQSVTFTGPGIDAGPDGGISSGQAFAYIAVQIDAGLVPPPNGQTVYVLFLPPDLAFTNTTAPAVREAYPSGRSTGDNAILAERLGALAYESQIDRMTKQASGEIINAAIDPLNTSWGSGPIADPPWSGSTFSAIPFSGPTTPCNGTSIFEAIDDAGVDGFAYLRVFSNVAAQRGGDPCLPSVAPPYYGVSTPQSWYPADAGAIVSIPLTGWATAQPASPAWYLAAAVAHATGGLTRLVIPSIDFTQPFTSDAGLGENGDCTNQPQCANDVSATLSLTIPADAGAGDYLVLTIDSYFIDAANACQYASPESGDQFHQWYVGIYVP